MNDKVYLNKSLNKRKREFQVRIKGIGDVGTQLISNEIRRHLFESGWRTAAAEGDQDVIEIS